MLEPHPNLKRGLGRSIIHSFIHSFSQSVSQSVSPIDPATFSDQQPVIRFRQNDRCHRLIIRKALKWDETVIISLTSVWLPGMMDQLKYEQKCIYTLQRCRPIYVCMYVCMHAHVLIHSLMRCGNINAYAIIVQTTIHYIIETGQDSEGWNNLEVCVTRPHLFSRV